MFQESDGIRTDQPCVYVMLDEQNNPLYIGVSKGLNRAFSYGSLDNRCVAFRAQHHTEIFLYETITAAEEMEAAWIHRYHPQYNLHCPECHTYTFVEGKR